MFVVGYYIYDSNTGKSVFNNLLVSTDNVEKLRNAIKAHLNKNTGVGTFMVAPKKSVFFVYGDDNSKMVNDFYKKL